MRWWLLYLSGIALAIAVLLMAWVVFHEFLHLLSGHPL